MGTQILFGFLFIAGGTVGVVFWLALMKRTGGSAIPGVLKLKKHNYSFEAGDNLLRMGGVTSFSGMDIHLPDRLPHVFLDGYANNYMGKSQYIFDGEEKVPLDDGFNLYAQRELRSVAFAIFSGRVLDALRNAGLRYDVEIMDDHVRLILPANGPTGLSRNQAMKQDAGTVAMAIMREVDRLMPEPQVPQEVPEKPAQTGKKHHGHHGKRHKK
jgi:hypothetical protein